MVFFRVGVSMAAVRPEMDNAWLCGVTVRSGLISTRNISCHTKFYLKNTIFQALLIDSATKSSILRARRRETVVLTLRVRDGFSALSSEWKAVASGPQFWRWCQDFAYSFIPLSSLRDVLCGLLLCTNLTAKPSFGELQGKLTSLTIQHQNRYMDCRWARCWGG